MTRAYISYVFYAVVTSGNYCQFVKQAGDDGTIFRVVLLLVTPNPPLEQHET